MIIESLPVGGDELCAVTTEVWTAYISGRSVVRDAVPATPRPDDRLARVDIDGSVRAALVVRCDAASADAIARRMFDLPDHATPDAADVDDALGELANVVGGAIKAMTPHRATLGLPTVGTGTSVLHGLDFVACSAELAWENGRANLSVWSPAGTVDSLELRKEIG